MVPPVPHSLHSLHAPALAATLLLSTSVVPAGAQEAVPAPGFEEQVEVIAHRLPADAVEPARLPAAVTVITREDIARSGARTVYEALLLVPGLVLYDNIGNGVQQVLDLRGFANGTATSVLLDGVRFNEPDDNRTALELISIEAIERIEVRRGSAGPVYGGGAMAGVVNVVTRGAGRPPDFVLGAAAGTFDSRRASVAGGGGTEKWFWSGSLSRDTADGFRDNGATDLNRALGRVGARLGESGRLSLAFAGADDDLGAPGALTRQELQADREQAPFNRVDHGADRLKQTTLEFEAPLAAAWSLSGNASYRAHDVDILTTGRTAAAFGSGFATDTVSRIASSVIEARREIGGQSTLPVSLTIGGEGSTGAVQADGFLTDLQGRRTAPASATDTDRDAWAVFVGGRADLPAGWSLSAGARRDRLTLESAFTDFFDPAQPTTRTARSFGETTWFGGVTWTGRGGASLFASFGEGFLPPTSNQLFDFPGFGSNPDLQPTRSRDSEVGYRQGFRRGSVQVTLFRIDLRDEIVFFLGDPAFPFGINRNLDQSHRLGVEAEGVWRAGARFQLRGSAGVTEAETDTGPNRGKRIPLVPRLRVTAAGEWTPQEHLLVRLAAIGVSDQRLSGDEAGQRDTVPAYVVFNLLVEWRPARLSSLEISIAIDNLLDREYEVRGVFALDQTGTLADFFTPAPPRRLSAAAAWRF